MPEFIWQRILLPIAFDNKMCYCVVSSVCLGIRPLEHRTLYLYAPFFHPMLMAIWNLSGSDACSSPKSFLRVVFPPSGFVIHAWGRPAQERMSASFESRSWLCQEMIVKSGLAVIALLDGSATTPATASFGSQARLARCRYPNHKAADAIMPLYCGKTLISRLGAAKSAGGCHRENQRVGGAR